jgi:carboxyl-terminal processing protease
VGVRISSRIRHLPLTVMTMAFAAILLAVTGFNRIAFADRHQPMIAESAETAGQANLKVFEEVWSRVRDSFYDSNFGGQNWEAIGKRYRRQAGRPGVDLARLINQMLAELGASHVGYYTPAETAYYDLADIFAGGLRQDLPRHFPGGEVSYVGIGVLTCLFDGKHFIAGVLDGFPAGDAKLTVGDELIAVNGAPFEPVRSFMDKAGQKVTITIRRKARAEAQDVGVTPRRLRPNEMYRSAMENSARIIEIGDRKIGFACVVLCPLGVPRAFGGLDDHRKA